PKRLEAFHVALKSDVTNRAASVKKEIAFIEKKSDLVNTLLELNKKGQIPYRITHNDTKLNNVMIDEKTSQGICVIDLDTVMPGFALYDFGDMVRTATSPAPEDERDLSKVTMRLPIFQALVRGYLSSAGEFLTPTEKSHLVFSGKLMTFELVLRFLMDHLQGDTYFKIHRENHNLDRCRTQVKLINSIEEQENEMQKIVESI
ncbi:MAG: aminoglycoside phosphotransferase family protein, partial [Opitutaceae bacterium]|nr:aminoglycoside phosphotransferase family protein [Opitutaceae bacterium]